MNEILKKITIKDVMGDEFDAQKFVLERRAENDKWAGDDLMMVIGTVNEVVADSSQYGDFYFFQGAFEATRLLDGVIVKSTKCILPEPINGMMGEDLKAIVKPEDIKEEPTGEGSNKRIRKRHKTPAAQFGVILGIKPSKKGARGYEWVSKPVVQPQAVDTLADLRSTVMAALKALPAPAKETQPTKTAEKPGVKK